MACVHTRRPEERSRVNFREKEVNVKLPPDQQQPRPPGRHTACLLPPSPRLPSCTPGYVTSITGRRRPLPRIHARDQQLRAQAERQAVNFVVQGTCSPQLASRAPWFPRAGDTDQIIVPCFLLLSSLAGAVGRQQWDMQEGERCSVRGDLYSYDIAPKRLSGAGLSLYLHRGLRP